MSTFSLVNQKHELKTTANYSGDTLPQLLELLALLHKLQLKMLKINK